MQPMVACKCALIKNKGLYYLYTSNSIYVTIKRKHKGDGIMATVEERIEKLKKRQAELNTTKFYI